MKVLLKALLKRDQYLRIFGSITIILSFVIVPIAVNWWSTEFTAGKAWAYIDRYQEIHLPSLIFFGVVLALITLSICKLIATLLDEIDQAITERDSVQFYDEELKEKQFVDAITGIPNSFLRNKHLAKIIGQAGKTELFHAMIIDLVGFRVINRRFTPSGADRILRKIAQDLRGGMRRNEQMYRRRKIDASLRSDAIFLNQDLYRKYPGGDEFYRYIKGD